MKIIKTLILRIRIIRSNFKNNTQKIESKMNFNLLLIICIAAYCNAEHIVPNTYDLKDLRQYNSFQQYLFKIIRLKMALEANQRKNRNDQIRRCFQMYRKYLMLQTLEICNSKVANKNRFSKVI